MAATMPVREDAASSGGVETGILHAGGGTLRWKIAGSTLYCSDFEGDRASYAALVDAANAIAVERFAAVLVTRVAEHDIGIEALRGAGFIDDTESFDGHLTLVRDVR